MVGDIIVKIEMDQPTRQLVAKAFGLMGAQAYPFQAMDVSWAVSSEEIQYLVALIEHSSSESQSRVEIELSEQWWLVYLHVLDKIELASIALTKSEFEELDDLFFYYDELADRGLLPRIVRW